MNIFKQLFSSIYSPKIISTFRLQGIGKTILYVFLLSLLSTIPTAFHFTNGMTEGLKGMDQTLQNDLPSFKIEDNTLSVESEAPIEIEKDDFSIILDDTGTYDVEEIEAKHDAIGILQDRFVIAAAGQSQSYEYNLLNIALTKDDLISVTEQFNQLLPILITIVTIVMYLIGTFIKFIEITFLALLGLAFKNSLQRGLNFKQVWVLSAYSTTLATVFFIIMDCFQITVPSGFLLNWFVHLIIIFLVLKEVPPNKGLNTAS